MEHNLNYIALICARGGSKGLPGKNIKLFNIFQCTKLSTVLTQPIESAIF